MIRLVLHRSLRTSVSIPVLLSRKLNIGVVKSKIYLGRSVGAGVGGVLAFTHLNNVEPKSKPVKESNSSVVAKKQAGWFLVFIRKWIWDPLLLLKRTAYLSLLFFPVLVSIPMMFIGQLQQGVPSGRLWWFKLLSKQMERAGPSFVKLAQWAASRTDLFPRLLCEELSMMHFLVRPHEFAWTEQLLSRAQLSEMIEYIDQTPVGVGAIAQVHKARLTDEAQLALNAPSRDIAIKVIHPRVEKMIERDLKIISLLARALSIIPTFYWVSLPEEVETFAQMMRAQLDMTVEAKNLEKFRDGFQYRYEVKFPSAVDVPGHPSYVLMEELIDGIPMSTFLKAEGTVYDLLISGIGLEAFLTMLIVDNFIHADLHPGNIFIQLIPPKSFLDHLRILWNRFKKPGLIMDSPVDRLLMNQLKRLAKNDYEGFKLKLEELFVQGYEPRLVFLDAGLVTTLAPKDRANFLDLFNAVASFDGLLAGKLMVERSTHPEMVKDPKIFELKMQDLLLRVQLNALKLSKIKFTGIIQQVMDMVRDHHVKLAGEFVNVFVSVLILEGIGRQLNPDLDLLSVSVPILRELGKDMMASGKAWRGWGITHSSGSEWLWMRLWLGVEVVEWLQRWLSDQSDEVEMYLPDV